MKLYHVEHSVLTTETYALMARDEAHLKELLAEREAILRSAPFESKIQRDASGKIKCSDLSLAWNPYDNSSQQVWSPKLGR